MTGKERTFEFFLPSPGGDIPTVPHYSPCQMVAHSSKRNSKVNSLKFRMKELGW